MSTRTLAQLYAELATTNDSTTRDDLLDAILDHPDHVSQATP